jgi:hypothetical protein
MFKSLTYTHKTAQNCRILEDALLSEVLLRRKMQRVLTSTLAKGQELDRTKKQPDSDLERTRENLYSYKKFK